MFSRTAVLAGSLMLSMSCGAMAAGDAEVEKRQAASEIGRLVAERDFPAIERRLEREARSEARFADGFWRHSFGYSDFRTALGKQITDAASWDRVTRQLLALAKTNPKAWLLLAECYDARAWSIRGSGYAATVAPEAWPVFRDYLNRERNVLDGHKRDLARNPTWYSMRMSLATELGEPDAKKEMLFDEAVSRHPGYHAIYFAKMRDSKPIWGGSKSRMLDFLDRVASLGGKTADEALYARLVWFADDTGFALTHEPRIDQEAMRTSSRTLARTYPAQWNVQKLFFMACERADKTLAVALEALVTDPPLASLLADNVPVYESCRQWAQGTLPSFIIRDHDHGETKDYVVK